MFARTIVGGQPRLDCLVGGKAYPLPFLVEVGVLGSVPGGTVLSQVIAFAAALAVLATSVAIGAALGGWLLLVFFLSLDKSAGLGALLSFRK